MSGPVQKYVDLSDDAKQHIDANWTLQQKRIPQPHQWNRRDDGMYYSGVQKGVPATISHSDFEKIYRSKLPSTLQSTVEEERVPSFGRPTKAFPFETPVKVAVVPEEDAIVDQIAAECHKLISMLNATPGSDLRMEILKKVAGCLYSCATAGKSVVIAHASVSQSDLPDDVTDLVLEIVSQASKLGADKWAIAVSHVAKCFMWLYSKRDL